MTRVLSSWLPNLIGPVELTEDGGDPVTARGTLNFKTPLTLTDDSVNERTDIEIGTVPTTKGGTGLTAIGTALQVLRVNAGATALEWAAPAGGASPAGNNDEIQVKNGTSFGAATGVKAGSGYISWGSNPPSTGVIRLGDSNAAVSLISVYSGGADRSVVEMLGSQYVSFSSLGLTTDIYGATVSEWAATSWRVVVDSTERLKIDTTAVKSALPIIGNASPYGMHGQVTKAMADANQTLSSSEYCYGILMTTGALTADRNLVLPSVASDAAAYTKIVDNACTGSNLVVTDGGVGSVVTMAPGTRAMIIVSTAGVREAIV